MALQELYYGGSSEPTYILNSDPLMQPRNPYMGGREYPGFSRDLAQSRYRNRPFVNPSYSSSAYARYISPPRRYTSSYSHAYSSPYIDSAYRSGYGERSYGQYNSAYDRFGDGVGRYSSYGSFNYDRGTPYVQMNDGMFGAYN